MLVYGQVMIRGELFKTFSWMHYSVPLTYSVMDDVAPEHLSRRVYPRALAFSWTRSFLGLYMAFPPSTPTTVTRIPVLQAI